MQRFQAWRNEAYQDFRKLTSLLRNVWWEETVPQEFHNTNVIHQHQCKGDRTFCDNDKGISLLAAAGKILDRVMLSRLTQQLLHKVLPESQCRFHSGCGTAGMVVTIYPTNTEVLGAKSGSVCCPCHSHKGIRHIEPR